MNGAAVALPNFDRKTIKLSKSLRCRDRWSTDVDNLTVLELGKCFAELS